MDEIERFFPQWRKMLQLNRSVLGVHSVLTIQTFKKLEISEEDKMDIQNKVREFKERRVNP